MATNPEIELSFLERSVTASSESDQGARATTPHAAPGATPVRPATGGTPVPLGAGSGAAGSGAVATGGTPVPLGAVADTAAASGEERRQDVAVKQQRVAEFLEDEGYDALLLESQEAFAWFTSGGENSHGMPGASCAALFVTPQERYLLASNAESGRLFEEEIPGLGFQLKESRWYESERLFGEICAGRKVASDTGVCGTANEARKLSRLRLVLTPLERQRYRELGRDLSHALEATARSLQPGETEAAVAGELAHRLLKRLIVPVELLIAADGRGAQFRRPVFKSQPIKSRCMMAVVGRRWGLCAAASRTVSFGPVPEEFRAHYELASMLDATFIFFSRPGELAQEVFRRVERIYEKFGHPHEWTLCDQGGVIGYQPLEVAAVPESPFRFMPNMALSWSPTIGSARSQDTILIDGQGFEVVTKMQRWPSNVVSVKGYAIDRPGVLIR